MLETQEKWVKFSR